MIKIRGYTISYKAHNNKSRTILNHLLFGRLVYRNYRGRQSAYYVPGMLDDKKFYRILQSKIFVENMVGINVDVLNEYADLDIKEDEREDTHLKTGREYWSNVAREKELPLRVRRTTRGNNGTD